MPVTTSSSSSKTCSVSSTRVRSRSRDRAPPKEIICVRSSGSKEGPKSHTYIVVSEDQDDSLAIPTELKDPSEAFLLPVINNAKILLGEFAYNICTRMDRKQKYDNGSEDVDSSSDSERTLHLGEIRWFGVAKPVRFVIFPSKTLEWLRLQSVANLGCSNFQFKFVSSTKCWQFSALAYLHVLCDFTQVSVSSVDWEMLRDGRFGG